MMGRWSGHVTTGAGVMRIVHIILNHDTDLRVGNATRFRDTFDDHFGLFHYDDVIMGAMAYQITSLTIVYSTVY